MFIQCIIQLTILVCGQPSYINMDMIYVSEEVLNNITMVCDINHCEHNNIKDCYVENKGSSPCETFYTNISTWGKLEKHKVI